MDGSAYEPWERQGARSDGEFLSSRRVVIDVITTKQHNTPTLINTAKKTEGTAKSFDPPTPHPQFLGELNDNQIHVRIAQLLDELRMLNIALAKRDSTSDATSDTESQMQSPITPGFRVGRDLWYLPSARKGSVEVYDMGDGRHDSWFAQPAPVVESVSQVFPKNGNADNSSGKGRCTSSGLAEGGNAHREEDVKADVYPGHHSSA